jgi:hypothetical protein
MYVFFCSHINVIIIAFCVVQCTSSREYNTSMLEVLSAVLIREVS